MERSPLLSLPSSSDKQNFLELQALKMKLLTAESNAAHSLFVSQEEWTVAELDDERKGGRARFGPLKESREGVLGPLEDSFFLETRPSEMDADRVGKSVKEN